MRDPSRSSKLEEMVVAGQAALEGSRFEEAANYFRSALRMGPRNAEEEALIRCELSEALGKRGLGKEELEAVSKYGTLSELARLSESGQMKVLVKLGWAHSHNNDVPRAVALFNQAMRMARSLGDEAAMGACDYGLGRAYRNLNEIRIARDHYTSALEHYRKIGNWRELAESYINIGYINAFEGNHRNALHALKQSLAIIGDRDEFDLRGRAYMYMAITHDNLGETGRALASWETCIESFRKAGNALYIGINENNLAIKLLWLGQWDRAEQLAAAAAEKLRKTTGVASLGGILDTLAQMRVLRGDLEKADELLEESLQVLGSVKVGEWAEVSTRETMARSCLAKGEPEEAIIHLQRAIDICLRSGTHYLLAEVQLWMAEALLETGNVEGAREIVNNLRSFLRDGPDLIVWGFLMRMVARIEAFDGHLAAAIQSLGQSSSIYELRGNVYAVAINRMLLASMLEEQGRYREAVSLVKMALETFSRLGAVLDQRKAGDLLQALEEKQQEPSRPRIRGGGAQFSSGEPDLVSGVDGFIARRMVQASVSRELILYELAAIVRDQASARAILIAETGNDGLRVEVALGLNEVEKARLSEALARWPREEYLEHFVYSFSDNVQSNFLLHVIEPRAQRFVSGTINMQPLLYLAEQGLENQVLRGRNRRTQVFDPSQVLSRAELPGFICASRAMSRVLEQVHKIRSSDVTVLITGESGTGKELVARAIHAGSSRKAYTFLPFNCSAAPRDMIESQLFGYRKGAFTGAVANYDGIVRAAKGGTLFLDEIGDLPLELQPKLLRFLQDGEIHPLGEPHPLHVDVRVIAATNSDLERSVAAGRFREDLFHRLNVIRLQVPPLRERREEIPALVHYYLNLYQQESTKSEIKLAEEVVDLMVVYNWPGNVRQLSNEVRRMVAYSDSGSLVTADMLSPEVARASRELTTVDTGPRAEVTPMFSTAGRTLGEAINELERKMIREALEESSGNIARAAKALGLSRKGLYLKMDRLNFNN